MKDDPLQLIDWGTINCGRNKKKDCVRKIRKIIEGHKPSIVILEDCVANGTRQCPSDICLVQAISRMIRKKEIEAAIYSQPAVLRAFSAEGARNKEQITNRIADMLPDLLPLPPHRENKINESFETSVLYAIALILTYYRSIPRQ